MTPEFVVQLAVMLGGAGAVYGGIRAELRSLRKDTDRNSRAIEMVHARIDTLLSE